MRWVLSFVLLSVNAGQDLRKKQVLPVFTGVSALAGLLWDLREGGGLFVYGPGVGLGLCLLGISLLGGGAVGLGDGLVLLALGLWLPWEDTLGALLFGLGLCALAGAVLLARRRTGQERIPFIPFLLLGLVLRGGMRLWG